MNKLDLRRYMRFNSEIVDARFDAERGAWDLKIRQTFPDGTTKTIEDDCDLLLGAIGVLDRWNYPAISGIEKFKGKIVHTAGCVSSE